MNIKSIIANSNIGHRIHVYKNRAYYKTLTNYEVDIATISEFDFARLRNQVLQFVNSLRDENGEFRFASSSKKPCLYATVYGYLIYDLIGELDETSHIWLKDYLDSFQIENGLFYDDRNYTSIYDEGDGWGARHLALHIIILYESINSTPKYNFSFLEKFHDKDNVKEWIQNLNWKNAWGASNAVMNIGCLLQYQRDYLHSDIGDGLEYIIDWLETNMIEGMPLWHEGQLSNETALLDSIRASYHLLPILVYEGFSFNDTERINKLIISAQNKWGGFDFTRISSACHDIDALDPLIRLNKKGDPKVEKTLILALNNIMFNHNDDGGFVFSRDKDGFCYGGCENLRSLPNESNIFGTWFRLVSILEILDYFNAMKFSRHQVPGYEYELKDNNRV